MPFGMPFYYCGKTVHSFSDVAAAPSPMLEAAATSFAPVLLSLESWTPHAYLGTVLQLTVPQLVGYHRSFAFVVLQGKRWWKGNQT